MNKEKLVRGKIAIEKENMNWILSRAWQDSFAQIHTNKNAFAERGWTPLNHNSLLHPEIMQWQGSHVEQENCNNDCDDKDNNDDIFLETGNSTHSSILTDAASVPPDHLNLSQGLTGTLIADSIIETMESRKCSKCNVEEN